MKWLKLSALSMPLLLLFLAACCSLPRIVFLRDTLTAEEHNDLGVVYEKKRELDLAEKEYLLAIDKRKDWFLPYFNLGNLYYRKLDVEKSEKFYRKSLDRDEQCADCMNNLAYLLYEKKQYGEALEFIKRAIRIQKKTEYLDTRQKIIHALK
jgi:tetratricopeptide (TPR) repeat protein